MGRNRLISRGAPVETAALPGPLGVGFTYIAELPPELYQPGLLDFVEVTPEALCRERREGTTRSMVLVPEQVERARETCGTLPIVVHGVELSIGSAHSWNSAYLDMLDSFQMTWPFLWHSEHLGFQTIPGDGGTSLDIGVPLPLPATEEVVLLVANRSAALRRRYGVPFLLENPAHYLAKLPYDPAIGDEFELMKRITASGGCLQLLDLHNLYCNSVNHGFDAFEAIDRMNLDRVVEIHVAGGAWREGFWMDAHDGRVPKRVWELLEYTLPRGPNVCGVVFELLGENALRLGADAIAAEVDQARRMWRHCRCRSPSRTA
ncbi:MAG TPA: DUF692 family protein [Candidatus Margulisiibacteriota bacterium]|nr:DUF692 family protein [Candidatus Margulisiibacteriota bacterium]